MEATGEGARGEGEGQGEGGRLVLMACSLTEKQVLSSVGVAGTRARRCLGGVEGEKGRGEEG